VFLLNRISFTYQNSLDKVQHLFNYPFTICTGLVLKTYPKKNEVVLMICASYHTLT